MDAKNLKYEKFSVFQSNIALKGSKYSDERGNYIAIPVSEIPNNFQICGKLLNNNDEAFLIKRIMPEKCEDGTVIQKAYY